MDWQPDHKTYRRSASSWSSSSKLTRASWLAPHVSVSAFPHAALHVHFLVHIRVQLYITLVLFFVVMFVNLKYVRPLVAFTIKMKFILRYLAWSISCGSKMTSGSIFLKEILICEIFSFHLAKLNLLYFKISRYVCNFSSGSLNNPDADNPDAACLLS